VHAFRAWNVQSICRQVSARRFTLSKLMTCSSLNLHPIYRRYYRDHTRYCEHCVTLSSLTTQQRLHHHRPAWTWNKAAMRFYLLKVVQSKAMCRGVACKQCLRQALRLDNFMDHESHLHYLMPSSLDLVFGWLYRLRRFGWGGGCRPTGGNC
jgi:hypothetical protein